MIHVTNVEEMRRLLDSERFDFRYDVGIAKTLHRHSEILCSTFCRLNVN